MSGIKQLEAYGFKQIGKWSFGGYGSTKHLSYLKGIQFTLLDSDFPNGFVYAFTFDQEVVYVGETTTRMGMRFEGYRYGNPLERDTDNRVKIAITEALIAGKNVLIWILSKKVEIQFDGETISVSANKPIEEWLIRKLSPPLNNKKI